MKTDQKNYGKNFSVRSEKQQNSAVKGTKIASNTKNVKL